MCEGITEERLEALHREVSARLSAARFSHTLGVERAAIWMGERLCPQDIPMLRAAALLHDVTKEYSFEKQLKICCEFGIILRADEKNSPQILHAITAAAIIPAEFAEFATPTLIGAVRWHTTGRADMTLAEKIIFLADYIEDGRKYPDCEALRESFMRELETAPQETAARAACLDHAVLSELRGTLRSLSARDLPVNEDTLRAEEYIAAQYGE